MVRARGGIERSIIDVEPGWIGREGERVINRAIRPVVFALAWSACTDEILVAPVIDVPFADEDASAISKLDRIELKVATAGSEQDLVSQSFSRGQPLVLAGAPLGDDLVIHMVGIDRGSTIAYGRSCPFQVGAGRAPIPPHLFFSLIGKFASLELTPVQRSGGRAVPYLGGAIFVGGTLAGGALAAVERFDPATGLYDETLAPVELRIGAVDAVLGLSPPRIALIGGSVGGAGAPYIELIDPGRPNVVITYATDLLDRAGLTATTLADGRVVVIGGKSPAGGAVSDTVVVLEDKGVTIEALPEARLAQARTGHTATRLGNDVGAFVLIAGGVDGGNPAVPIAVAELYKPLSAEFASPATFAPAMIVPRSQHQAALMKDGSVLIIGGVDAMNMPVRKLELFSLDAGFVDKGDLPLEAGAVDITATRLPDQRVLISGGRPDPSSAALPTAFIASHDPVDGTVSFAKTDNLAAPRAGHQAVLLCDGTVLITGGTDVAGIVAERYNPPVAGRR